MTNVEINLTIPVNPGHSPYTILEMIRETLEDRFSEIDDIGNEGEETVADTHGFGGNTITLTMGEHVEEICLS